MNILNQDFLEVSKKLEDKSINTVFCDSPYQLGTRYFINEKGEWDIQGKSVDFMNKWEGISPKQWDEFFIEADRFMKYGGYMVMFGLEENGAILSYYAIKHGFEQTQSLFWFQISGFPKSLNISKGIDKKLGNERENCGFKTFPDGRDYSKEKACLKGEALNGSTNIKTGRSLDKLKLTKSNSELGQKYEGYKFGKKPLKPSIEQIFVFRKPLKNKSGVEEILEYESGNKEISPPCINIDGERVNATGTIAKRHLNNSFKLKSKYDTGNNQMEGWGLNKTKREIECYNSLGRYPSQLLMDSKCAELIDKQSGERKGWTSQNHNTKFNMYGGNSLLKSDTTRHGKHEGFNDTGGASRICHICDYENEELELVYYCPKVNKFERNQMINDNYVLKDDCSDDIKKEIESLLNEV